MKLHLPKILPLFFGVLLFAQFSNAQNVGIGTTTPAERLHVAGNLRVDNLAGTGIRVVGSDANGTLTNIGPGTNGEVIMQTAAGPTYQKPVSINSTSLNADVQVSSATWANVAGMTVTFTATQTEALIMFSGSGFAFTGAMAFVEFRIRDGGTTIGGTNTKMQSYDDVTGTVTAWNCNFTKKVTGLTIGTTYTYSVQGQVAGILGTPNAAVFASTFPDSHHLTLTVLQ